MDGSFAYIEDLGIKLSGGKPPVIVHSFRDLLAGQASAEIINLLNGKVVRTLYVHADDSVTINADGEVVAVPLDTPIVYEPWEFDRGSLLFTCEGFPNNGAKIATELDLVRYPDGTTRSIEV